LKTLFTSEVDLPSESGGNTDIRLRGFHPNETESAVWAFRRLETPTPWSVTAGEFGGVGTIGRPAQYADASYAITLLCPHRQPRCCRAAVRRDEIASLQPIEMHPLP
jgi:hypothetical protein